MVRLSTIVFGAGLLVGASAHAERANPFDSLSGVSLGADALATQAARGAETAPSTGSVTGNTAGAGGGPITVDRSMAGNSGLTTVFQNTGNNVLMQNSTTINITLR